MVILGIIFPRKHRLSLIVFRNTGVRITAVDWADKKPVLLVAQEDFLIQLLISLLVDYNLKILLMTLGELMDLY